MIKDTSNKIYNFIKFGEKISKVNNIRGFSINIISLISGQIVIALISLINSVVIARAWSGR